MKKQHTLERATLIKIHKLAKKYAAKGNGQGKRIARLAAEGLGVQSNPSRRPRAAKAV